MTPWLFIRRSLRYYWRTHISVILGAALGTAILVGALVIGDSVRYSLRRITDLRLGRADYALSAGDRTFRIELARGIERAAGVEAVPLMAVQGMAFAAGGARRVNRLDVYGVDSRFGALGNAETVFSEIGRGQAVINNHLAERLGLQAGEEFVLRLEKPGAMPRETPLALDSDLSVSLRLRVKAVASDDDFGRFSLRIDQSAPFNVYLSLPDLCERLELDGRANRLLVSLPDPLRSPTIPAAPAPGRFTSALESAAAPDRVSASSGGPMAALSAALDEVFTPADAGLELKRIPARGAKEAALKEAAPEEAAPEAVQITSERIFIDEALRDAVLALSEEARPILTYFVNRIRHRDRITPYSFVSSPAPGIAAAAGLAADQILLTDWAARDLAAGPGDRVTLSYYVLGPMRRLIEKSAAFEVAGVVPLRGAVVDPDLMPRFPGLADQENCRDWDPGIPIDLDLIREKDEEYWDLYRGTPKAYIALGTAQRLWSNRFGDLTAVRIPYPERGEADIEVLSEQLKNRLNPAELGFSFEPVRKQGLDAGEQSVDFAQLFLGLSFFIILSALLLTGMLFAFSVDNRNSESGLLLALGLPRRTVHNLLFFESVLLALAGAILGAPLGLLYDQIVLHAMRTAWHGIVGTSALWLHAEFPTVLLGIGIGFAVAALVLLGVLRKRAAQTIVELQRGGVSTGGTGARSWPGFVIAGIAFAAVAVILLSSGPGRGREASTAYFAAGALLLAAGFALFSALLIRLGRRTARRLSFKGLGVRGAALKRGRSLALVMLLASGLFIVFTVGANRQSPLMHAERRGSGTGGFALWAETTLPVLHDLDSGEGRDRYNIPDSLGIRFFPMRFKAGDDASCLNLHRVSRPRLLGIDPAFLSQQRCFTFAGLSGDVDPSDPWSALDQPFGGLVPGIADQTVIIWGLGAQVGDTLIYSDESGASFGIVLVGGLANSVFQGHVLIAERRFVEKYPSAAGYERFLVDAPLERTAEVRDRLEWSLGDLGWQAVPAAERLALFNRVENTYLSIFTLLGGFGLLLGSIGLGILVLRNVLERRYELALLRAVGFPISAVRSYIFAEHLLLFGAGLGLGLAAALISVLPALLSPGTQIPYLTFAATLLLVVLNGLFWLYAAVKWSTRGDLLPALRSE